MSKVGVFFISGFRENERASNGTEATCRAVESRFDMAAKIYQPRPWDEDMRGLAAKAARDGITDAVVIGYSWGGGFGLPRLCKELGEMAIRVVLAGTCDAVYRPLWLSTKLPANVLSLRSILPGSAKIEIPANVARIFGCWQTETIPKGHAWKLGPWTQRGPFRKLPYPHTMIDDSPEWREMVIAEIELYLARS